MGKDLPPDLALLLDGPDPETRARAWSAFLDGYSRLLLKAAGAIGGDYDARMDRYRYLVDALAADDFRRLRAYRVGARSAFPAWLTVVARRLCVDFERTRHGRGGRATAQPDQALEIQHARRRLAELVSGPVDPDQLPGGAPPSDIVLRESERHAVVECVLGELEPRDRLLLRFRFEDDRSIQAIADLMDFPTVFHVYRRLRVVLSDLRRRLEARGIDGVAP